MKSSKASKTSSRVRNHTRSVKISSTAHGLTNQAGLIPVVKYLDRIGFEKTVKRKVAHPRGDNADYHLSDAVLLTLTNNFVVLLTHTNCAANGQLDLPC
jgi:hypothetical protein